MTDKKPASKSIPFGPLGNMTRQDGSKTNAYGVRVGFDPETNSVLLAFHADPESIAKAPIASSGKTRLVANTAGFVQIPGTDIAVNLVASKKLADSEVDKSAVAVAKARAQAKKLGLSLEDYIKALNA